jgi:hypothetical protein
MRQINLSKKSLGTVTLSAFLLTCILASLVVIPVLADDAGFALRFDGTTDFVDLPLTTTVFDSGWETDKSVALWVKPDGLQTNCTTTSDPNAVSACDSIFGDRPTFWGISIGYLAGQDQNRIWVWNYDNSSGSPYDMVGIDYTPGVWTHIALVHSGGVLRAFKNGVEVGSTPSGATIWPSPASPRLTLGGVIINSTTYWLFQGDIDEVSLWDRALTGSEIQANMYQDTPTDTTDLAAFYRMSDGSGTVLTDDSSNGNTGTLLDGRAGLAGNGTYPLWVDSGAFDITGPTVTINQAPSQADPTNGSSIVFDVVFSESVTGFGDSASDVDLSASTAGGPLSAAVSGSGANYTVTVTGMSSSGQVIASIPAGAAQNASLIANYASTSTDNSVTYDITPPTVTINQAAGQADPTNTSPINFTVVFSESVTGFTSGDVVISGIAGTPTVSVTGGPVAYNVAVSGMANGETVSATIGAGAAIDGAGNASLASTSTDNSVTYDTTPPTVTITQAVGQADPTSVSPINFTVTFSEAVSDFATGDVTLSGSAGANSAVVTGGPTVYNVVVSGMTTSGTVTITVAAGVAHDAAGNANTPSINTDNTVTYLGDTTGPTVTINQAAGQADPTNASPINFTAIFSENVTDFTSADVTITGVAGSPTVNVTGSGTTYNVAVSGMVSGETVVATIAAGVAHDGDGNPNSASTSSDNRVTYDTTAPTVTINQADTQPDPTINSPIRFTVIFSEAVTGFTSSDVTLSGTAGATTVTISGSGTTYTVSVSGMTTSGSVMATVNPGAAQDAAGNNSAASTSTDSTVEYIYLPERLYLPLVFR